MSTLLLRLASPLQAWGVDSKFERRGTMREPTKSGVIGLLAAALGRGRDEAIDDLARLSFGVRIDQPGQLLRDFHTARGQKGSKIEAYVTERYYLADAIFLVGLEGDETFLLEIDRAIKSPAYPLFLGRRSCPPTGRVSLGVRDTALEESLQCELWQASEWYKRRRAKDNRAIDRITTDRSAIDHHATDNVRLTIVIDAKQPGKMRRRDMPISFSQKHRKFDFRYVDDHINAVPTVLTVPMVPINKGNIQINSETSHDPFSELGG